MTLSAFAVARRAIRHRPGRSVLVVAVAALAVAAATATAAYQRAGHASLLADAIRGAPAYATEVSLVATGATPPSIADGKAVFAAAGMPAGMFGAPIGAVSTEITLPGGPATLVYRDGFCAHVTVVGRCPSASGEVAVSALTSGLAIGDRVGSRFVVGLYTPMDSAYWGYFAGAVFVGEPSDVRGAVVSVRVDAELVGVRLDDLEGLRAGLGRLGGGGFAAGSGLGDVIAGATRGGRDFDLAVLSIGSPLVLLCLGVLVALVGALAAERAPEIALASLRGYAPGRAARFAGLETSLLVALATPIGFGVGVATVAVVARTALAGGVGVEPRWPVAAAALGTAGVAGLVGWVVTARWGSRPALELMRSVGRRRRGSGWIGAGAFALTCATVTAAAVDRTSPVAWLAAPSVALLLGLAAARALAALGRWTLTRAVAGRSDPTGGPATGVVAGERMGVGGLSPGGSGAVEGRGAVDRRAAVGRPASDRRAGGAPAGRRVLRVVVGARLSRAGRPVPVALASVAVALVVFGALGWDAGAAARAEQADDAVGADRVYTVRVADPAVLVAAVDAADPGGRAMAVARTTQRYAGADVDVIGVDSARLAAVARWRGLTVPRLAALAAALTPAVAPALVTDGRLSVTVTARATTSGAVELGALLAVPGGPPIAVPLGTLADGTATLAGGAVAACRAGCRLAGLTLAPTRPGSGRVHADVRVTRLLVGGVAAGLDAWRGADRLVATGGRTLRLVFDSTDLGPSVARYVDAPEVLPVAVAGPLPSGAAGAAFTFPGLRDNAQPFTAVARPSRVPRAGGRALLFDLTYGVRAAEAVGASGDNLRYEVWAGPGAPADLARRLSARGVTVVATQTRAGYLDALDRAAPALGLGFYLGAGAVALLFAAVLGAIDPLLGGTRRAAELAALSFAGVRRRALARAVTIEALVTSAVAWLVGTLVGAAGAVALAGPDAAARITVTWSGALAAAVLGSALASAAVMAAARAPLHLMNVRHTDVGRVR